MHPIFIFYCGVVLCGAAVLGALFSVIILHHKKVRLSKLLDIEFGRRSH